MGFQLNQRTLLTTALIVGLAWWLPSTATAAVTGQCANCHTMHASQGGAFTTPPDAYLLKGGCLGCHSHATDALNTNAGGAPVVLRTTTAPALNSGVSNTYLAGGDFYWVDQATGDAMGHNVLEVNTRIDADLGQTPPGYSTSYPAAGDTASPGATGPWTNQLTCEGANGCHGSRDDGLKGAHHGGVVFGYRFLKGISGTPDGSWEYTFDASTHNQYLGVVRAGGASGGTTNTMSYFCAECHGDFHSNDSGVLNAGIGTASPWVRHPVDVDLQAAGGEYTAYTTYDPLVPVASTGALVNADVQTAGNGLVTCVSCHRAHGSEHDDLLRWDYAGMVAGTTTAAVQNTGCFKCHSTKDAG